MLLNPTRWPISGQSTHRVSVLPDSLRARHSANCRSTSSLTGSRTRTNAGIVTFPSYWCASLVVSTDIRSTRLRWLGGPRLESANYTTSLFIETTRTGLHSVAILTIAGYHRMAYTLSVLRIAAQSELDHKSRYARWPVDLGGRKVIWHHKARSATA